MINALIIVGLIFLLVGIIFLFALCATNLKDTDEFGANTIFTFLFLGLTGILIFWLGIFSSGRLYPAFVEFTIFQLDTGKVYEVQGETLFSDKEHEGHHLVVFREIFPEQDKYNQVRIFKEVPPKKFTLKAVQGKIVYLPAEEVF